MEKNDNLDALKLMLKNGIFDLEELLKNGLDNESYIDEIINILVE